MRVTVKVDDREFEVEVGDLRARPIVARVDGEKFEVWATDEATDRGTAKRMEAAPASRADVSQKSDARAVAGDGAKVTRAPIPGVIVSVAVHAGESVKVGQELCVLEAMKMKNAIRAARDGMIEEVKVSAGQQVAHGAVLLVFVDE